MNNNKFKCYNCGKLFKDNAHLTSHKNRKTPCLIRDVPPEQIANPNRCIFCNKIFSKKENLTRHLKICKIKNGGMDILDEKTRYEQEIRILKEQRERDKIEHELKDKQLRAEMEELKAQVKQLVNNQLIPQQVVNNNINNINNGTINNINIVFNNYDKPFIDTLKFTQDDLLVTNIARKVIEMIYFNKDLPQNHTLYMPNIKEKRLLVYKNNEWKNIDGDELNHVMTRVKNSAYTAGINKINGGDIYATDEDLMRLYPVVREAIQSYNTGGDHAKCSDEEIFSLIKNNKQLINKTLVTAGTIVR